MTTPPGPVHFVISVFDRELWCPVLVSRLRVPDLAGLRGILGTHCENDPELRDTYELDGNDMAAVEAEFGGRFGVDAFTGDRFQVLIGRQRLISAPYLVHTGYELPLLLDGRKKMARFDHEYPPRTFDGEDRFDRFVTEGRLHKDVSLQPFDRPLRSFEGSRTVFYTPIGEEWRVQAFKSLAAAARSSGWNDDLERAEGELYGYEDWQNDWWASYRRELVSEIARRDR